MTNKFYSDAKNENKPADNTKRVLMPSIITAICCVLALTVILIAYLVLNKGVNPTQDTGDKEDLHLLDGEVLFGKTTLYLFQPLSSTDLKSISVEKPDPNNSFTLERADGGGFFLNGNPTVTYSDEAFSSLMVATCNTITSERVYPDINTGAMPSVINYANFGLDEENMNARYTLTTTKGETYTVRIGNLAPSGDGYYACLEGREAVYILDDDLQTTVLGTTENIVTPTLGLQTIDKYVGESNYIEHLTVWQNGKHVSTIHSKADQDFEFADDIYNFAMACNQNISSQQLMNCSTLGELENILGFSSMSYNYVPDGEEYNKMASSLPNLQGSETVALKDSVAGEITDEQLASFGIDRNAPAYEIFYTCTLDEETTVYNHLIFSEPQDGFYYAFSNLNSLVAKIPEDQVSFLSWDYYQWVEPHFYQKYITDVSELTITTNKIDYKLQITHGADVNGDATMVVTDKEGKLVNTENYRNFYRTILTRNIRGAYTGEMPGEDKLFMTITFKNLKGKVTEYKFYTVDSQRVFFTANGKGEFYCIASSIRKIESDAIKLANGEAVKFEDWT